MELGDLLSCHCFLCFVIMNYNILSFFLSVTESKCKLEIVIPDNYDDYRMALYLMFVFVP